MQQTGIKCYDEKESQNQATKRMHTMEDSKQEPIEISSSEEGDI